MPRQQYGAIPFRVRKGVIEEMLVTSRDMDRWIVPKGWPKKGGPRHTAESEAYEESGVRGKLHRRSLGSFKYKKNVDGKRVGIELKVYPLAGTNQADEFPERKKRLTRWFSLQEATRRCSDPALGRLIRKLAKEH